MTKPSVKIATAQYDIGYFESFNAYREKVICWVDEAREKGAELLVFPEYACMELTSLFAEPLRQNISDQLVAYQDLHEDFCRLYEGLAVQHQLYIQPGTFPVADKSGSGYLNRAYLFGPQGEIGYQDKQIMTRFEDEHWQISPGNELKVFDLPFAKVGINICFDSEFPLLARQQVEAGAELILVPSCTDTMAGYYRVQTGCRARALENQCYVVQAATLGEAEWSPAVDENHGAAAVYTPIDRGFPDDGILSIGPVDQPQWVYAELDFEQLSAVRKDGQVLNHRDWDKQLLKVMVQ